MLHRLSLLLLTWILLQGKPQARFTFLADNDSYDFPQQSHLVDKRGPGIILWSNRLKNLLISSCESESGKRDETLIADSRGREERRGCDSSEHNREGARSWAGIESGSLGLIKYWSWKIIEGREQLFQSTLFPNEETEAKERQKWWSFSTNNR